MKLINLAFSLVAALGSTVGFAQSVTIDFQDRPTSTDNGTSFSSQGFSLVANGGLVVDDTFGCGPSCPQNGTKILLTRTGFSTANDYSTVVMTRVGGGFFALSSFDGAGGQAYSQGSFDYPKIPTYIHVSGNLATGGTVAEDFSVNKDLATGRLQFTTYDDIAKFSKFSNLSSVTFSAIGAKAIVLGEADQTYNGFTLDNIVATPVPEPESYAMMLVGFGLIGTVIRQRKSLQA